MTPKAKSNSIVTHKRLDDGRIEFAVKGALPFTFNPMLAAGVNREYAEYHGWCQRIPDGAAVSRTNADGTIRTQVEMCALKRERMQRLVAHYESGAEAWGLVSAGGGGKSITIQAAAEIAGITYDAMEASATKRAAARNEDMPAYLAYLRTSLKVQERIAEIRKRSERPVSVDADDELEELMAE
jgi:hypothetical protein